jgi:hypothetical protein
MRLEGRGWSRLYSLPHFASTYRLKKVKGSYMEEASLRLGRVDTDYDEGVDGFNIEPVSKLFKPSLRDDFYGVS